MHVICRSPFPAMAVHGRLTWSIPRQLSLLLRDSSCSSCRKLSLSAVTLSRYNKDYLDPTFSKEELAKPLDESDPRRFQPIKAAEPEQTSSVRYDPLVVKFIRAILSEGEKARARNIIDKTFETIKIVQLEKWHNADKEDREYIETNPNIIFHQAVENCRPLLITQDVRRGGVIYKVPIPVKPNYQTYKAIRWLIESANDKGRNVRIWDQLAQEMIDASKNEGKSVRRKQELHKLCEANRAYAHFRW